MEQESLIKKELMAQEFQYNIQLAQARAQNETTREKEIEDRKDERVRIQGTQQSELIDQRKNDLLPKNFESAGFDNFGRSCWKSDGPLHERGLKVLGTPIGSREYVAKFGDQIIQEEPQLLADRSIL